jgi:hypothetical protein
LAIVNKKLSTDEEVRVKSEIILGFEKEEIPLKICREVLSRIKNN